MFWWTCLKIFLHTQAIQTCEKYLFGPEEKIVSNDSSEQEKRDLQKKPPNQIIIQENITVQQQQQQQVSTGPANNYTTGI